MELFLILAAGTLIILAIRYALSSILNKGADAITNAVVRSQEEKNPPQAESLADRYKQSADAENNNEKTDV